MNKAQKFLLENNLDDIVLNAKQYPDNTLENANKWIYLSDVLEQYPEQNKALRIQEVRSSCPLCHDSGEYTTGGSFGGPVTVHKCDCGAITR